MPNKSQSKQDDTLETLQRCKQQLESLDEGVFSSWNKSPVSWIFGGGALLALLDGWIHWLTIAS